MVQRDIPSTSVLVNAINQIGLEQIATDAVTYTQDDDQSKKEIDLLIAETGKILLDAQNFDKVMTQDGYNILKDSFKYFQNQSQIIYQWQRISGMAKRSNLRVASSIFDQRINYLVQKSHIDFWSKLIFNIPESIGISKATKWYNKAFPTEEPNESDMYIMQSNGFKSLDQIYNKYREDMSFSEADAKNLASIRYWQIGVPSLREAWIMVQRGYWQKADWLNLARLGHGFTAGDAENYYKLFNYDPSLSDVLSLSNIINLEPSWINEKLNRTGMNASDKALYMSAIAKKAILQEIRSFWGQIQNTYAYGGYSETELKNLLVTWQFQDSEINIKLATLNLARQKTVNSLMRDADIYLYRTGAIVEYNGVDGLYDRLLAQDIPAEVCNAITRCEACKKGNDWELPE